MVLNETHFVQHQVSNLYTMKEKTQKRKKTVHILEEMHTQLKMLAITQNKKIEDVLEEFLTKPLNAALKKNKGI